MSKLLSTTALSTLFLAAALSVTDANANPLDIGVGSTPVTVASQNNANPQNLVFASTSGAFSYSVSAAVDQEPDLFSNTIDITTTAAGTLDIWVSSQNNFPLTPAFLSSFTSNSLPPGWTVTESTFVSNSNLAYAVTDPLATHTFNAISTNQQVDSPSPALTAPFSVTEEFIITSTGAGTANSTIDLTAVPEPASLAIFGAALLGFGAIRRRRNRA